MRCFNTMDENSENASPQSSSSSGGASLANGSSSGDTSYGSNGGSATLTSNNMANGTYSAAAAKPNGSAGMPTGAIGTTGNASSSGQGAPASSANGVGSNSTIGGKGGLSSTLLPFCITVLSLNACLLCMSPWATSCGCFGIGCDHLSLSSLNRLQHGYSEAVEAGRRASACVQSFGSLKPVHVQ